MFQQLGFVNLIVENKLSHILRIILHLLNFFLFSHTLQFCVPFELHRSQLPFKQGLPLASDSFKRWCKITFLIHLKLTPHAGIIFGLQSPHALPLGVS